jgi:hypothetical protein
LGRYSYFEEMKRRARTAIRADVADGAALYERARSLPRVLPMTPSECAGAEPQTTKAIVRRLADALRRERRLGRGGHWTYDLNRHIALAQAWKAESEKLARTEGAARRQAKGHP